MRALDVSRTALGNTMRSKLRTFLTVIAIVIGAFTLTLTSGLGAGVNNYVDDMVAGFGDEGELYVQAAAAESEQGQQSDGPPEYDPQEASSADAFTGMSMLSDSDIETIEGLDHVTSVEPMVSVSPDFLENSDGDQFQLNQLGTPADMGGMELAAGEKPDGESMEMTIPEEWISIFDADDPEDVLGETVQVGISNVVGDQDTVEAEIVGVSEEAISGVGGQPMPSNELNDALYEIQTDGYEGEQSDSYIMATAEIDDLAAHEDELKSELSDNGLTGMTLEDQLGAIQGVINTVTWVLSGFALIALLAASFGIVNTLLMSVQERTREIGLMKALGMSSGKVFGLFSMEAVVIGLMGSVIGIGLGAVVGVVGNNLLVNGPLSNVAGLTLYAVAPSSLLMIAALIVVIAFVAGTLPAARAAKKDPIEALRYE
jgi:putative ABC transport system permease protein